MIVEHKKICPESSKKRADFCVWFDDFALFTSADIHGKV